MTRIANWSDQGNPENPPNPDETSVSVACPTGSVRLGAIAAEKIV